MNETERRADILERANARGFTVNGKQLCGTLTGYNLEFPRLRYAGTTMSCEISWDLAERLANGDATNVNA